MALTQLEQYQSVKDDLPPSDGKFYEVMVIMYEDNICGGYKYRLGLYTKGIFQVDENFYFQKDGFRNFRTQLKVIAWQPLQKCSTKTIREFIRKAGIKAKEASVQPVGLQLIKKMRSQKAWRRR
nr:hypothetical protein [Schwartzia sp. (in: firmicutes)]